MAWPAVDFCYGSDWAFLAAGLPRGGTYTLNIPLQELAGRLDDIPRSRPVVVGCASGTRSGMARLLLKKNGYAQVHNIGVWRNFLRHGRGA